MSSKANREGIIEEKYLNKDHLVAEKVKEQMNAP